MGYRIRTKSDDELIHARRNVVYNESPYTSANQSFKPGTFGAGTTERAPSYQVYVKRANDLASRYDALNAKALELCKKYNNAKQTIEAKKREIESKKSEIESCKKTIEAVQGQIETYRQMMDQYYPQITKLNNEMTKISTVEAPALYREAKGAGATINEVKFAPRNIP